MNIGVIRLLKYAVNTIPGNMVKFVTSYLNLHCFLDSIHSLSSVNGIVPGYIIFCFRYTLQLDATYDWYLKCFQIKFSFVYI